MANKHTYAERLRYDHIDLTKNPTIKVGRSGFHCFVLIPHDPTSLIEPFYDGSTPVSLHFINNKTGKLLGQVEPFQAGELSHPIETDGFVAFGLSKTPMEETNE